MSSIADRAVSIATVGGRGDNTVTGQTATVGGARVDPTNFNLKRLNWRWAAKGHSELQKQRKR